MKVLLVGGTWARRAGHGTWWQPGSPFAAELVRQGHALAGPPPYTWSTAVDGVEGEDLDWEAAAEALTWYVQLHPVEAVIAHSHGGNVVALACAMGLWLQRLVTVATPVRREDPMQAAYAATRAAVGRWTHLHSDWHDRWQWWGSLMAWDCLLPWRTLLIPREMALAHGNLGYPGMDHTAMLDPAWWTAQGLWARTLG